MSVLIKGMTMPLDCTECQLYTDGARCGITNTIVDLMEEFGQRNDDCPLVEIETPHGRLIDADKLKLEYPHDSDWDYPVSTNCYVNESIENAPTVIEAEGKG